MKPAPPVTKIVIVRIFSVVSRKSGRASASAKHGKCPEPVHREAEKRPHPWPSSAPSTGQCRDQRHIVPPKLANRRNWHADANRDELQIRACKNDQSKQSASLSTLPSLSLPDSKGGSLRGQRIATCWSSQAKQRSCSGA